MQTESFPRQSARTRRFSAGAPRLFSITTDGSAVLFLRSNSGTDAVGRLWSIDATTGEERLVADPSDLLEGSEELSQQERARRERMREGNSGIVGYSADRDCTRSVFTLSGGLYAVDLAPGATVRGLDIEGPVIDPRLSPDGSHIAYSAQGSMRVVAYDGANERVLVSGRNENETAGLTDFIAAEELSRSRGFWWSPDSDSLIVERADETPVQQWWIANPVKPSQAPTTHRYPAAGTANALVSLVIARLDGTTLDVAWDVENLPYLVDVAWNRHGEPLAVVSSRDQQLMHVLAINPASGQTRVVAVMADDQWVDVAPGATRWTPSAQLLTLQADRATDTYRLHLGDSWLSPAGLQIHSVLDVDDDGVTVSASLEPTHCQLLHVLWDGSTTQIGPGTGWITGRSSNGTDVIISRDLKSTQTNYLVRRGNAEHLVQTHAEQPSVTPAVQIIEAGEYAIRTAVLFPTNHVPGSRRLPILMSPYGGPHGQQVVAAGISFGEDQWLADQGFCVVVADGRGTPSRGPAWDRTIFRDLATLPLADQVVAVAEVVSRWPNDVDPSRVGIRGWSFGGYLAALAVLRRPDVFHAAVAGAPVTDWRLYDTAYTERYLGNPTEDPAPYNACSLMPLAEGLTRPLLLIHGLTDDNVVVAHTLELSGALTVAGRPHQVLPLSGVTHMTPQEEVAENKLLLELDFLRSALGVTD